MVGDVEQGAGEGEGGRRTSLSKEETQKRRKTTMIAHCVN